MASRPKRSNGPGGTFFVLGLLFALRLAPAAIASAEPAPIAFPAGTFTLQTYATYAAGLDYSHAEIPSAAIGGGYFVFDDLSLSAEASGYFTHQGGRDGGAYSFSGVLRHHFLTFDRFTLFADVSFGPIMDSVRLPATGTYFNFATRTGLGLTYHLHDNLYLMGGARYFHLSNAKIEGRERNPSINGVEGFLGLMWTM